MPALSRLRDGVPFGSPVRTHCRGGARAARPTGLQACSLNTEFRLYANASLSQSHQVRGEIFATVSAQRPASLRSRSFAAEAQRHGFHVAFDPAKIFSAKRRNSS